MVHTGSVPDRDVFPGLHRSWRSVGRAVFGAQPVSVVASMAEKALAEQIRKDAGASKFARAAAVVARTGDTNVLHRLVTGREFEESPLLRALETVTSTASSHDRVNQQGVIANTLRRVTEDQLNTLRPKLVNGALQDADLARRYLERCASSVQVDDLADQIAKGADRIRAPRRPRKRMADLLYQSLT
jgi:hypothetical protein